MHSFAHALAYRAARILRGEPFFWVLALVVTLLSNLTHHKEPHLK
jgi:hypothetical protein